MFLCSPLGFSKFSTMNMYYLYRQKKIKMKTNKNMKYYGLEKAIGDKK